MVKQPQFVIFTSTTRGLRSRTINDLEFGVILVRDEDSFRATAYWVSKQERVKVSDPERTVIDGMHLSAYCGGITEVAKGLRMRRHDMEPGRLIDYALRLQNGAVARRRGYLLDIYQLAAPGELDRLRLIVTVTYTVLA